ncbi:MAG: nucleoside triphosphate pyrophosphohydrolase [Luteitalea sp.]|nr:nucleoside triphosphate pyrophosphohydrolase [Luteitalea sp.]
MSSAGDEFTRLVEIMATLRGRDGCPWDREQTIASLRPYVLEETYELLEAIDRQDHEALCEELGDFLFEAVFIAQLESESGFFGIADAVRGVADKLVRRHPHVFARDTGEAALDTANQVRVRWEEIKAEERRSRPTGKTLLGGIPVTLPALLRASQIGARATSVGFDWAGAAAVVDKMQEEVDEIREVVSAAGAISRDRVEEEIGDLLFAVANLSRKLGIEPESALRKANDKFTERFTTLERRVEESGRTMSDMTLEELDAEWRRVKERPAR